MTRLPDAAHATHDLELVAAYAAGDATAADLDAATALVAGCRDCAALHHDLRAIAAALPLVPASRRTRDFRISPEQADTLRPRGWRRFAAALAGPGFRFAAPLGTGLATLGLAGLLLGSIGGSPLFGGGSTAGGVGQEQSKADFSAGAPQPAPAASVIALPSAAGAGGGPVDTSATMVPADASPGLALISGGTPPATDDRLSTAGNQGPVAPTKGTEALAPAASPVAVVLPGAAIALLLGLGLLALRIGSRRLV